jgi:uncharacterized protein involved in response to NO
MSIFSCCMGGVAGQFLCRVLTGMAEHSMLRPANTIPRRGAIQWPPLFRAPHRVMFLAGAVQILAAFAWWSHQLALRLGPGAAPAWPIHPGWLHGLWLIYGVYPFFMFGFLMTAMPRWQGAEPVPAGVYLPAAATCASGWLAFWTGLAWPAALPAALALVLVGWMWVWRDLVRVAEYPHADRRAARLVVAAVGLGALGLAFFLAGVMGAGAAWLRAALEVGLWGFLAPVFAIVSHRMIPFFSSVVLPRYEAYRPQWLLYLLLAALAGHGLLGLAGMGRWLWVADALGAAAAGWLTFRWRPRASRGVPLLAMLHLAFLWLGIGLFASALQSAAALAGHSILGLAPLHAITLGFFSSMLLGMATRVTLGHSGRDLAADRLTLAAFATIQGAAVLRIAADLVPPAAAGGALLAAALAVFLAFGAWFLRHAPAYWRPRADGRPG